MKAHFLITVKRAQEVMLFGNQQNRPTTENKFYPSSQKRGKAISMVSLTKQRKGIQIFQLFKD
jgi:hypothetical protein